MVRQGFVLAWRGAQALAPGARALSTLRRPAPARIAVGVPSSGLSRSSVSLSVRPRQMAFRALSVQPPPPPPQQEEEDIVATVAPPDLDMVAMPPNVVVADEEVLKRDEDVRDAFEYIVEPGPKSAPLLRLTADRTLERDGDQQLSESVWSSPVRSDIIHRVVVWQRSVRRGVSTAKVKTRGERSGTTRKPHPQKGTGRARQGSKRAPHMHKGGRVHGPDRKDYTTKLPKKVRRFGLRAVLSARLIEGQVFVVDSLTPPSEGQVGEESTATAEQQEQQELQEQEQATEAAKNALVWRTAQVQKMLDSQKWNKVAFVDGNEADQAFEQGARNIKRTKFFPATRLNVLDLLKLETLVITKAGLADLETWLDEEKQRARMLAKRSLL